MASSTNDDEQRQILIDSFAHASTLIRNEARELRRLKAPPDAGGGWFRVLVQMRSDAQLFEFASNDLRRGPTYGAPFQHADPAVMRFVRSYGFKVCGKALRLGYG